MVSEYSSHRPDNTGVAFDAVGCSCGWSAKATSSESKRSAFLAHARGPDCRHCDWVNGWKSLTIQDGSASMAHWEHVRREHPEAGA